MLKAQNPQQNRKQLWNQAQTRQHWITAFLGEHGIASVPAEVLRQLSTPLSVCCCSANNSSPWKVSHVSSDSFFKNKHGEMEDCWLNAWVHSAVSCTQNLQHKK